jgi:hypothetical protein
MNNFFVNLHAWLKSQLVFVAMAVVFGLVAGFLHFNHSPVTFVAIATLVVLTLYLTYANYRQYEQLVGDHDEQLVSLHREHNAKVTSMADTIEDLRVKLHGANINNATLRNQLESKELGYSQAQADLAAGELKLAEKLARIEDLEVQLQTAKENALFSDNRHSVAKMESDYLRQHSRELMIFLASVYESGTRQENYLDGLHWFLYVDAPGSQVRFLVPELSAEISAYDKDAKTFVNFLKALPAYEKAWDGHLPNMVYDRLVALAGKLHDTRLSPPIALASTGKAPTKARVAKKRARGPKA